MYKTFTEWKNGNWLEDGEPRKEAYTKDELLLVEMGWKYGFDAGKAQQADRIAELEKKNEPVAWMSPDGKVSTTEGVLFYIPLYTTPQTKPLSDDEIQLLINDVPDYDIDTYDLFKFAKAIEAKVRGEK